MVSFFILRPFAGGRCSPRKEEVPDGDIVMGRVYPTSDPAESLFDYRVASDANKKLALGAKQWSMRRRPFFLGVGFHHPHTKWRIPQKTWRDYGTRRIAMPEITRKTPGAPFYAFGDNNIAPTAITIDGTHHRVPAKPYKEGKELPEHVVRELRRGYLASVAFLDVQVGRVLDQVDDLHLTNDTVIIFTSDHGYGIGERGHWGKGSLYEIDARVPLIVRDPHHRHMWGTKTNALVELVDLYKSVIDLAHLPFGRNMYQWLEGKSWRSIVESGQGGNSHALTIVPKCYGKKHGDAPPHNCGGRSYEWHRMEGGTKHALVGFAARSHRWRYVAWMDHNESLDAVDWARAPVAEEFYDNSKMDETDLDSSDALNLLSAAAQLQGVEWADIRDKADAHLRWLRQSARDRFFRAFGEYAHRLHDQSDAVKAFLPSHQKPAAMPPRDPPVDNARTPRKKPRFPMMGARARRRQEWGRV